MKEIDFRQDLLPLKDKLFRLALRITLNRLEAEDLTQDTLLRAWSHREDLAKARSIEAYCVAMCRNLALDYVKRSETKNLSLEAEQEAYAAPDQNLSPEEELERKEKLARVHQLISALPEQQRTAIQLRDIEEMTYAEAAEAMGLAETNFRVILHRARKAIKQQYETITQNGL